MVVTSARRAQRVYNRLHELIRTGALSPGARLPGQVQLAEEFGVALMTVRQAISQLADEGLISVEHGRGMFVRSSPLPGVLVVEDEDSTREILLEIVDMAGFRGAAAANPAEALAILEADGEIGLVLTDVRMPSVDAGINFIRTVRRRWSNLPVAAVTAYALDLQQLEGQPECPVLVIRKPFHVSQIDEALRLALGTHGGARVSSR